MADVPDEILREILSRLPVAPLLRFRCVSKPWKGLIDNEQFIKHHLNHSRKTNSNLNIILDSCHLYSADFDLLNETNVATFKELSQPLKNPFGGRKILGSCDDLLVFRNDKDDVTILWNPSIRRFHEIPSGGIEFPESSTSWEFIVYGFGYDVVSDDYKLVRIAQFHGKCKDDFKSKVKVYSLKSGSWREVPDFPYYIKFKRADVLVNGASHWIVGTEGAWNTDSLAVAFDLGTEEYRLVPLPKLTSDDVYMILGVVGGCLSVMYYDENEDHVEVWVMKEYGVQESWSTLFTFDIWDFEYLKLIAYSKCGRKVLIRSDERVVLTWYDLDKKSTESPIMLQMPLGKTHGVHICLQSLVLFNGGTCDFDLFTKNIQKKEEQNDKILKKDIYDQESHEVCKKSRRSRERQQ